MMRLILLLFVVSVAAVVVAIKMLPWWGIIVLFAGLGLGFVVFLKSRLPANEEKMKQEMPRFMEEVRRARQGQAFQEWFRKSMETARISGRLASTATGS